MKQGILKTTAQAPETIEICRSCRSAVTLDGTRLPEEDGMAALMEEYGERPAALCADPKCIDAFLEGEGLDAEGIENVRRGMMSRIQNMTDI